jgi:hypothetical protein
VCARIHLHLHLPAIYSNAYSDGDADSNGHAHTDSFAYSNSNGYAHTDSYGYGNSNGYAHTDSYTYFDAETFTDAEIRANAQAACHAATAPVTSLYENETHYSTPTSRREHANKFGVRLFSFARITGSACLLSRSLFDGKWNTPGLLPS